MRLTDSPPEPWRSFFDDVNAQLTEDVHLHCCGGFVVAQLYQFGRETNDVDFLSAVPDVGSMLTALGGEDSPLHKKHRVYLDAVTIVTPPENYEQRLISMFSGAWEHLQISALEAHDLLLCKLERNSDKDREDLQEIAKRGHIKPDVLEERYRSELRPNLLARHEWHDQTLDMWVEILRAP